MKLKLLRQTKVNQVFKQNEPRDTKEQKFWDVGGDLKLDIMDITRFRSYNDEFGYIFVIVFVASRYAWAFSLLTKKIDQITQHIKSVYQEIKSVTGNFPKAIASDDEFVTGQIDKLNERYGIVHYSAVNEYHVVPGLTSLEERFIKTLRGYLKN